MEVDIFHVSIESLGGTVSRVRTLRNDLHNHELRGTSVHSLQMLLLHALGVEHRIVIRAAGATARAERLIEIVGILYNTLRFGAGAETADEALESLSVLHLLLLALTIACDLTVMAMLS